MNNKGLLPVVNLIFKKRRNLIIPYESERESIKMDFTILLVALRNEDDKVFLFFEILWSYTYIWVMILIVVKSNVRT
jgi:hypothetical protein